MSKVLAKAMQLHTAEQQLTDATNEQKKKLEQEQHQQLVDTFRQELEAVLSPTMKEELQDLITYEWLSYPRARFEYLDLRWSINRTSAKGEWLVCASYGSDYGRDIVSVGTTDLERSMLRYFGEQQAAIEQNAAEREEILAQDTKNRAELERRTQAAQAEMFVWPKDRRLTIYRMNVVLGVVLSDEHGATTNLLSGWTIDDHLDARRYATFQPFLSSDYDNNDRQLVQPARRKRFDEGIAPIWDEHIIRRVEDLPEELRFQIFVKLEGVDMREDEQGVDRLVVSKSRYPYRVSIGWQPLSWICDLLK